MRDFEIQRGVVRTGFHFSEMTQFPKRKIMSGAEMNECEPAPPEKKLHVVAVVEAVKT